jgi:hypothetical protein
MKIPALILGATIAISSTLAVFPLLNTIPAFGFQPVIFLIKESQPLPPMLPWLAGLQ